MQGKGKTVNESSPLMCVAGEHAYEIETEIELHGNVTAGMLLYYNNQFFQGTGFDEKTRYRYRMGGKSGRGPSGGSHLWLRLRNDNHIVTGEYSTDGKTWYREEWGMDISGYHHNTLYEFQSVLPALFVAGDGYATFKNFKYKSLQVPHVAQLVRL